MKVSLYFKLFFIFLQVALIPLSLVTLAAIYNSRKEINTQRVNQFESIASLLEARMDAIDERNKEKIEIINSRETLKTSLSKYMQGDKTQASTINSILIDSQESINSAEDISLIDTEGKVIFSTNIDLIDKDLSKTHAFIHGLTKPDADEYFLNGDGEVKINIAGPIKDGDKTLAVVLIRSQIVNLYTIVNNYTGLGRTGEILIVQKNDEGDVVFLLPVRFDKDAALKRTVAKNRLNVPSVKAVNKIEGTFTDGVVDYRGHEVIAVTKYIESADIGLVVKIDKSEALEPANKLANLLLFMNFASFVITVVISLSITKFIIDPIQSLISTTHKIFQGSLNERAEVTTQDEIGVLATSFNQMTDKIAQSNTELEAKVVERTKALESSKKDLEVLISERTKELEQAKLDLENKVKNRTKEFEDKLHELESINKITMDRELEMIELKKQIRELNQKLGVQNGETQTPAQ